MDRGVGSCDEDGSDDESETLARFRVGDPNLAERRTAVVDIGVV